VGGGLCIVCICVWEEGSVLCVFVCGRRALYLYTSTNQPYFTSSSAARYVKVKPKDLFRFLCIVDRASLYNLVNKTNFVHDLFLVYL